jgi:hypothetical protein
MPLYIGYAGARAEAQLQDEEGCVIIDDHKERRWFCKEITGFDPANEPDYAMQFFRMG